MPATAPAPAAIDSIAWWTGGTPWLRMPPPTRNMAAVPTIVSSFISSGAPARIARPTRLGERIGPAAEREAAVVELDDRGDEAVDAHRHDQGDARQHGELPSAATRSRPCRG